MEALLLASVFMLPLASGGDICTTKSRKPGSCILIANCRSLLPLADVLTITQFIENYGCGRGSDGNVRVCCPNQEVPEEYRQVLSATSNNALVTTTTTSTTARTTTATTTNPSFVTVKSFDRIGYTGSTDTSCDAPFQLVDQEQCIFIHNSHVVWNVARQICQSLGAELYVASGPEHFLRMRKFLIDRESKDHIWIGVKQRKWLSGRAVDDQEWRSGEPNGSEGECAFMGDNGMPDAYYIYDYPCESECRALCARQI